jgi:hypothetical protein
MKEITIKQTEKEYDQYVKKGQSEYRIRMKKAIEHEKYVKWMFKRSNLLIVRLNRIFPIVYWGQLFAMVSPRLRAAGGSRLNYGLRHESLR